VTNVLVIGNKQYCRLSLDGIIDSFEHNIRCNMGLPGNNSGTKYDQLGMCNHLYLNLISSPVNNEAEFYKKYTHAFMEDEAKKAYGNFIRNKHKFGRIFHAEFRTNLYNKFLSSIGCPAKFTKIPRTGYVIMIENLMAGNNVFVTNFSIKSDEERNSFYTKPKTDSVCHSSSDEVNILRWLHQNNKIDSTMCLLQDEAIATIECDGLEPTKFMKEKIERHCLSK